ncbi:MAG: site-specific integrase [Burkholderiaceae bacterium]
MPKPLVVEKKQIDLMIRKLGGGNGAPGYSRTPERDVALILVAYGTALGATELATLPVRQYLTVKGEIKRNSEIPAELALNGKKRPLKWVNERVCTALDAYLAWRVTQCQGVTTMRGAYRSLDPDSPIFLTPQGQPYRLDGKPLPSGRISYSCASLSQAVSKMHRDCGIPGGSFQSARRTFAVLAARMPAREFSIVDLAAILGIGVSSAKRLAGLDPKSMADIVRSAAGGAV